MGYTATRIDAEGQEWAERIPSAGWTPEQIAAFACRMNFDSRTWNSSALLFEVLEAMLGAEKEDWRTLETYYVQQMIKRLQADEQADESRLARLEFEFLYILGPQTVRAETLERMLARDPKLFVDCLKILYGPRHGAEEEELKQPDPHDAQRANLIWGLLRDWQRIPGTQPDGSISASELREWITAARSAARANQIDWMFVI